MQPKVAWLLSERIPAALLVTWGEKEVLKGIQLHSTPAVDCWDEEEEESKWSSKRGMHGCILIWLSCSVYFRDWYYFRTRNKLNIYLAGFQFLSGAGKVRRLKKRLIAKTIKWGLQDSLLFEKHFNSQSNDKDIISITQLSDWQAIFRVAWRRQGYLSNTFILKFIIFFFLFIRLTSKT